MFLAFKRHISVDWAWFTLKPRHMTYKLICRHILSVTVSEEVYSRVQRGFILPYGAMYNPDRGY
jgi:hypothetical protein